VTISGVAAPFNTWIRANAVDVAPEKGKIDLLIRPSAFAAALRRIDVPSPYLCVDHNPNMRPLASVASGTLDLWEDDSRGLMFEARLTERPVVSSRLVRLIEAGFVHGSCLKMATHPAEGHRPNSRVIVHQVQAIGALSLCLFRNPHFKTGTFVQVGPWPRPDVIEHRAAMDPPNALIYSEARALFALMR
jgi:hypothetical protein